MVKKIYKYIESCQMFSGYGAVVAGVSGGADSVCLIAVLKEIIEKQGLPIHLTAVHINHQIRGEEAQRDEEFARLLCKKLGVDFESRHVNVPAAAKKQRISEEEAGRILRYQIFREIAAQQEKKYQAKACIAVAHHKNDQAETVLMNLLRGSSLRGLCGMRPVRENIIRPLLCVSRAEIEKYLQQQGLSYVTDSTNLENAYTRNKVRNELIPYLERSMNPNVVEKLTDLAESSAEAEDYIRQQADKLFQAGVTCDRNRKSAVIAVKELKGQPPVLQRYVIRQTIQALTGGVKDVYRTHLDAVCSLLDRTVGKQVSVAYGLRAVRRYEEIFIQAECEQGDMQYQEASWQLDRQKLEKIWQGQPYILPVTVPIWLAGEGSVCSVHIVMEQGKPSEICGNNDYTKLFDYDKIKDNLSFRFRKTSDCIVIGRGGMVKTLKKELIDRKVPCEIRNRILLLACENSILWAVGIRRSETGLIEPSTKRILKISIELQEDKENGTTSY